jgi:threonine--tRNA ligase
MFIIKLDGGKTMEVDEKTFWHTTSHVMAQAIKRLYKNVKLAIGPAIDNGFYYDIDSEKPFTTDDLVRIEEEMMKIVKEGYSLEYREMDRKEAIKYYEELGEIYKVEILKDLGDDVEKVSFYKQGEFEDLCKGPHIPTIKPIKAIKLLSVSGAYWRGNEKNKMLQRIYGVSFPKKSMLDEYLEKLKEAKERDHRKIGKEQELFMTHELVGSGLPIFLPNGAVIKRILERYIVDKEIEQGYNHVYSPSLANTELYKISGHWDHYKEDMFPEMKLDNESFVLRPMNCPHHMLIYKNKLHSYRDLPIKIGEMAHDFRYEASGAVTGLERVRQMCQNDAHIFVTRNQIKSVVADVMSLILDVYKDFRISEYKIRLSLRDKDNKEKYYDDDEMWEKAESELREIVKESGFEYYEAEGEAAFYGPKLDVQIKTALRT